MDKELQEKLYADFPELFKEKDLPMTQTCMCWGIECRNGWEPIIRNVCFSLRRDYALARQKKYFPYQDEITVWFHNLCRKIEKRFNIKYNTLYVVKHRSYERFPGFSIRFSQIKEKFGTLRIYHNFSDNFKPEDVAHLDQEDIVIARERAWGEISGVLSMAHLLSEQTCEDCGNPGKLLTNGWWVAQCRTCAERAGKDYDAPPRE
jgi:hypothetical protein